MNWLVIDNIINNALKEDCEYGDITTESILDENDKCSVDLIAKEDGIIAGLYVFERVFKLIGGVTVKNNFCDGNKIKKGNIISKLTGNTRSILTGERLALNLIQRMSGIATLTNKFVKEIKGTKTKILDTRKTTPNLRILEKYSVKIGGGVNHRYNLSDGILIKDNHISAAGSIKNTVDKVRKNMPFVRKIEVEVETIESVIEALEAGIDIIMLDNMDIETMTSAVKLINKKAITEASGNMNLDIIKKVASTGVDYISVGALTHSVKALDISLKNLKRI